MQLRIMNHRGKFLADSGRSPFPSRISLSRCQDVERFWDAVIDDDASVVEGPSVGLVSFEPSLDSLRDNQNGR